MVGLIGGTGLGEALFGQTGGRQQFLDTPFGRPSGPVRIVEWHGQPIAILARHGPGHTIQPSQVPYRANIYALKSLGVTHILASGAVGSLREHIHPRELVIVDQIIDRTYRRTPTFFDEGLAVHVEFAHPFCPALLEVLVACSHKLETTVHTGGTYVCMEGPAFSTVAESDMHRQWGGDLIGMTAMPEAKLAREAEICYALVALVTDYDCWKPHEPGTTPLALLAEITDNLQAATASAVALMRAAIEHLADAPPGPCPIQTALDLAVWSRPGSITPELRIRYGVLLERFMSRSTGRPPGT